MISSTSLALYLLTYFLALWLGLYLLGRDVQKRPLLLTGLGLVSYAAALLIEVFHTSSPPGTAATLNHIRRALVFLPALFWTGMLVALLPESYSLSDRLNKFWMRGVFPVSILIVLAHSISPLPPILLTVAVSIPLFGFYILLLVTRQNNEEKIPLGLPLITTIFFGLAVGLALPLEWLPRDLVVLAIGLDLLGLGLGIAILDAFEEGHRLAGDMLRSALTALLASLIFGIQVGLTIAIVGELNFSMVVLLFSTTGTAVLLTTLAAPIRQLMDFLTPNFQERTQLRGAAGALDRLNPAVDFTQITDKEFQRLTRRAISYLGDLPRLASSPLTYLPIVTARLEEKQRHDDTLARAHELKSLLTESIQRLKPPGEDRFGMTDAWRYYNALHFPYVVGLKPSRRYQPTET
ncbi:MAG TPA: hypothetical protein VJ965_11630, partial [Anaerolineales bacterium]|nr:hypothetical protein [Anaerolineales bacterium]